MGDVAARRAAFPEYYKSAEIWPAASLERRSICSAHDHFKISSGSPFEGVITDAGGTLEHVTRTRLLLTDITRWQDAARAHGEFFRDHRPANTVVQVSRFIDPAWLVETEVDAYVA